MKPQLLIAFVVSVLTFFAAPDVAAQGAGCGYCDAPSICLEGEHTVDEDGDGALPRFGYHSDCRPTIVSCEDMHEVCEPTEDLSLASELTRSAREGDWTSVIDIAKGLRHRLRLDATNGVLSVAGCEHRLLAEVEVPRPVLALIEQMERRAVIS